LEKKYITDFSCKKNQIFVSLEKFFFWLGDKT